MNQVIVVFQALLFIFFPVSFYNNQVITLEGQNIDLSVYVGKPVLVVSFNQSAGCANELKQLDSLQKTDDSIKIIATPAIDFESSIDNNVLQQFRDSLGIALTITQPMKVKKDDGQDALYQWLTHAGSNNHFDDDVDVVGRIYVIDDQGVLYANAQQDITMDMLASIVYSNKTLDY